MVKLIKKYNRLRFLFYWLYAFFAIGVPIILISQKYKVFESVNNAPTSLKIAGGGMMIIVAIFFFLNGQIKEMIDHMEESAIKTAVIQIKRCLPILVIYFILRFAEVHMGNLKFIALWSFISNIIGSVFNVFHTRYKVKVSDLKMDLKIDKRIKAVKNNG